jgi:plastocyanin
MRPLFASLFILAACGDDGGGTPTVDSPPGGIDAPGGGDGATADAPGGNTDAAMSTVTVAMGTCSTPAAATLTTVGQAFSPNTLTIMAGESVQFTTVNNHNFASAVGVPAEFTFRSGDPIIGGHSACVTFMEATGGPIGFRCTAHPMSGTITVN